MCDFMSFYVSYDARKVWPGDLRHHYVMENMHHLSFLLRSLRPPIPCEWTRNDDGESLECRPPEQAAHDAAWYRDRILSRWPRREQLLMWCLNHMPEGSYRLDLRGCTELTALPAALSVADLDLSCCRSLTSLPNGLSVDILNLWACSALTSLPADLSVEELYMWGCTALTGLPDGLDVDALDLTDCTALTALPDDLIVREWLNVSGCTSLRALPAGLTVDTLDLRGCTALTALPHNVTVRDSLDLSDTSVTELPDDINCGDIYGL